MTRNARARMTVDRRPKMLFETIEIKIPDGDASSLPAGFLNVARNPSDGSPAEIGDGVALFSAAHPTKRSRRRERQRLMATPTDRLTQRQPP